MNFEMPQMPTTPETVEHDPALTAAADRFLGEEASYLSEDAIADAFDAAEKRKASLLEETNSNKQAVTYDKYKKSFFVNGSKATPGEIIASQYLGIECSVPEALEQSGDGKRLRKQYIDSATENVLFSELNCSLADALSKKHHLDNLRTSKIYETMRDRSEQGKEQFGVKAEKIITGFAKTIAIDRPDLGITVTPGNAFLDVERKIDFIIETTQKKRGVNVETVPTESLKEEHRTIGIQFTTNTAKEDFKLEQIAKAKERGINLDDITYVAIDVIALAKAVQASKKAGKPLSGPMHFLSKQTQQKAVSELFNTVLTEEQKESLLKAFA